VDPIADEFPQLSVYNYASNDPVKNIDLHGLQQGGNMFTNEIKNRTENVLKGSRDNITSAVDNAGEMLSNAGEAIREGYGQAKDYIENKVLGNQGSPNAEDYHDQGSAGGGFQEFSSGNDLRGKGTASTASAEEGAEVDIIIVDDIFSSGGGSGGMGPRPVKIIDNLATGVDKAKKAKEKYEEQNKNEGNDTTRRIPFGGDTVYWYIPSDQ